MNRQIWTTGFGKNYCPPWPCSACHRGTVRMRTNSMIFEETEASKARHIADHWGPEDVDYIFSAWADCTYEHCNQSYAISGWGEVFRVFDDEDGSTDWIESFRPTMILPTIDIINLPAKCPDLISVPLRNSFALYWESPGSSANQIRIALEELLTHIGVPSKRVSRDDKQVELPLHQWIELFSKGSSVIGDQLLALKWLGNAARAC